MGYKILVLLTFALISCKADEKKLPDLLSEEQMVSILIDVHVLEGKIDKLSIKRDSASLIFNTFEREIFKEHNVSKEKYIESYEYYLEDVASMNDIYEIVVDSLNFMQKSYGAKKKTK